METSYPYATICMKQKAQKMSSHPATPAEEAIPWVKPLCADSPAEKQICSSEQENALINTLSPGY